MEKETIRREITGRNDLLELVKRFYEKLLADETIAYIFTEVANIDLADHLPVLVDFWDMVLFGSDTYRKNALQIHLELNQKSRFTKTHFDTWLLYFKQTVDEMFEGEKAHQAKERATSIATVMQIKMAQLS